MIRRKMPVERPGWANSVNVGRIIAIDCKIIATRPWFGGFIIIKIDMN
jgi:hypothetical protein